MPEPLHESVAGRERRDHPDDRDEKFNGDASWTLPIPARFLIDRGGIIRWAEADPGYTTRPEPDAVRHVPGAAR